MKRLNNPLESSPSIIAHANDANENTTSAIRVFGARTHNLQNLDVEIPVGCLAVITGVSGSGKSSLAFDTIFAEGRHRYLSSVSSRSRERLQGIDRPDVDFIDALPPVLCVEQRLQGPRKRSTVATTSEIYDHLRLLFARVGQLHCPTCRRPVATQSRAAIVEQALRCQDRQKVVVLAPIVRGQAGQHADVFARIVKDGYVRARVDGEIVDASAPPDLVQSKPHTIDIVIDRLIIKEGIQSRLEESIDLALQLGQGQCVLSYDTETGWQDRLYSTRLACISCGTSFPAIEPRLFSFNSPIGACTACQGLSVITETDNSERACDVCQGTRLGPISRSVLIEGISITDFCALPPGKALETVARWSATSPTHILPTLVDGSSTVETLRPHESLSDNGPDPALPRCIANSPAHVAAAKHILPEIRARLQFLLDVGLEYLTLDRSGDTLSAGERQRTRLTACLGSQLTGVCYILDEPTAGLHARDTQRLLKTLVRLRDEGNTVLLIEHDLDVIRAADYVIDLGPGAGRLGGQVLATGTPNQLANNPASITGRYLFKNDIAAETIAEGTDTAAIRGANDTTAKSPLETTLIDPTSSILRLTGASLHNLKNVTIEVPLHKIVCVTGVSGSGKTSLIMHTLVPAIRQKLGERLPIAGPYVALSGIEGFARLVRVDQSPLGRSARSSPATYSGLWDDIRQVFAKTRESRLRGYTARQFSLGVAEARCPRCGGRGELPVDDRRFANWSIRCPECDGHRFAPATLSVRYRGQTVADVLGMSIAEAAAFFENFPRLARMLSMFDELGLGYLKLGQSATTLSGGEAQRIKLGTELARSAGTEGSALFVLDEPTSGLHVADVQQLVRVLHRLVRDGHSVLVIEHNLELIESADWLIEVGPGAGLAGGEIVSAGIPTGLN